MRIAFIEEKSPNMARIAELLEVSAKQNSWANRGPIYQKLQDTYSELFLVEDCVAVPVSNGGVALEAMARLPGHR